MAQGARPEKEKEIVVRKPAPTEIEKKGMKSWPTWSCEVSEFNWSYDERETCLILEGEVTVTTPGGQSVSFGEGDIVIFPRGLACTWKVKKAVKKHYQFA